jgi:hypothetical protein
VSSEEEEGSSVSKAVTVVFLLVSAGGCMSAVEVPPELPKAQQAASTAEELGAARDPIAASYLGLAHQQIGTAGELLLDGRPDDAAVVADRARSDAQLATALTRQAAARREEAEARGRVEQLVPSAR